ncbi:MAG: hypothetical protein WED07_16620 [Candidatus Freyarchaeum deiterrae]
MTEFDGSSEKKLKKEMLDIIGKVRELRLNPSDARVQTGGRPTRRVHKETTQIIDAQPARTPTKPETAVSSSSVQTVPAVKVESTTDTKTVSLKKPEKTKILGLIPVPQQKQTSLSKEPEAKESPDSSVGIESFYSKDARIEPKIPEKLKKIWESFIPRETICPYCGKLVLSIDDECSHCGAVNL